MLKTIARLILISLILVACQTASPRITAAPNVPTLPVATLSPVVTLTSLTTSTPEWMDLPNGMKIEAGKLWKWNATQKKFVDQQVLLPQGAYLSQDGLQILGVGNRAVFEFKDEQWRAVIDEQAMVDAFFVEKFGVDWQKKLVGIADGIAMNGGVGYINKVSVIKVLYLQNPKLKHKEPKVTVSQAFATDIATKLCKPTKFKQGERNGDFVLPSANDKKELSQFWTGLFTAGTEIGSELPVSELKNPYLYVPDKNCWFYIFKDGLRLGFSFQIAENGRFITMELFP
jgi:hypothetical protein